MKNKFQTGVLVAIAISFFLCVGLCGCNDRGGYGDNNKGFGHGNIENVR
jgi:hypothetical protein